MAAENITVANVERPRSPVMPASSKNTHLPAAAPLTIPTSAEVLLAPSSSRCPNPNSGGFQESLLNRSPLHCSDEENEIYSNIVANSTDCSLQICNNDQREEDEAESHNKFVANSSDFSSHNSVNNCDTNPPLEEPTVVFHPTGTENNTGPPDHTQEAIGTNNQNNSAESSKKEKKNLPAKLKATGRPPGKKHSKKR